MSTRYSLSVCPQIFAEIRVRTTQCRGFTGICGVEYAHHCRGGGTVSQAERLLALAEKGFEYGVKTRLDVEDAELNLKQAKGNLARARRDYLVARVNLEFVKGTLGEEGPAAQTPAKQWQPAESIPGIFKEIMEFQPRLDRKDDPSN